MRIFTSGYRQGIFSSPLESDGFHITLAIRILHNGINHRLTGTLHRSIHHLYPFLCHSWAKIFPHKGSQSTQSPATAWVGLVRVKLVLRHHSKYINTLLPVGIYELREIKRISLEIGIFLNESVRTLKCLAVLGQLVINYPEHKGFFSRLSFLQPLS